MKRKFTLYLVVLSLLGGSFVGCKKTPAKAKKQRQADAEKTKKWAGIGCKAFYKRMMLRCGDWLKKKKRSVNQEKFQRQCVAKAIKMPGPMFRRLKCAMMAPTCAHFRHCNKCGRFFCPKWKKGPKLPKLRKKPPTQRAGAPTKKAAAPTKRAGVPTKKAAVRRPQPQKRK